MGLAFIYIYFVSLPKLLIDYMGTNVIYIGEKMNKGK